MGPASCFVSWFVIEIEWNPDYTAGDHWRFSDSMKKTFSFWAWILAAVLFAASLSACGGQTPEERTEERTTESTLAPETEAPTTEAIDGTTPGAPETEEPTTEEPTTEEPTTEEPVNAFVPEGLMEYHYEGLVFCVPEGFIENEANASLLVLVPENYPSVGDNISFTNAGGMEDFFETYSEENLKEIFNQAFQIAYGAEMEDFSYKAERINGLDRVLAQYSLTVQGVEMRQISSNYAIGDKVVTETFTITSDTYTELFEAAVDAVWPEQ